MLSFVMGRKPFVKERILEAGFDLIARRGYEAVSTRDIAKAAEVGPASMYRHFPSKEDLGRELYERAMQPFFAGLGAAITKDLGPVARVISLAQLLYESYDERPRALALLIFPPHDFTPTELDHAKPDSIPRLVGDLLGCDSDRQALIWGALTGPLHDRYLRQRDGAMGPLADTHGRLAALLLSGEPA